ncbi:MAG: serine hydrolase domain-containing protein [Caldilineaceae bacterium]
MNPNLEQQLDTYIYEHMQRKLIPGLSLAVIKDGVTMIEKSYGFANLEHGSPATSDTVYQIASITKGFTAAAIMLLVADGKLSLDEALDRFRPGLPDPANTITIRQLIMHASGIPQWALDWDCEELTVDKIDQHAFGRPLNFAPGAQFEYVDTNYNILGMIIHQLTGAPYDAFLHERIFQPLRMNATCHNDWRAVIPNRADGYEREDGRVYRVPRMIWRGINLSPSIPANAANGGLLSTLSDLIKWDAALTNGTILSHRQQEELWSPLILPDGEVASGPVQNFRSHKLFNFAGGAFGFTTCMARFVEDGLTVIILTNQDSKPWDMCKDVAVLVEPALA